MTSREHYQRGLALLREVENQENELGSLQMQPEVASVLNQNMMRTLKKAEIHMLAAGLKVTYER